jgi:hypothetical protein
MTPNSNRLDTLSVCLGWNCRCTLLPHLRARGFVDFVCCPSITYLHWYVFFYSCTWYITHVARLCLCVIVTTGPRLVLHLRVVGVMVMGSWCYVYV